MLIVDTSRLEEVGIFPQEPGQYEEHFNKLCDESRNVLLKQWLPTCADILLELRNEWKFLIPKEQGDTLYNIEKFFECINALLSRQLRRLVERSLAHFLEFIIKFKASIVKQY